jgi:uncharacterized membrane protein
MEKKYYCDSMIQIWVIELENTRLYYFLLSLIFIICLSKIHIHTTTSISFLAFQEKLLLTKLFCIFLVSPTLARFPGHPSLLRFDYPNNSK